MASPNIHPSWLPHLTDTLNSDNMHNLRRFLQQEQQQGHKIYPPMANIFEALNRTPLDKVKAVIIGQDPYHQPNQAHGLSFSVQHGVRTPPSLQNIYKELYDDLGIEPPTHGCLDSWADQGVLLLNNSLTVRANEAASHRMRGWEPFTDAVITAVSQHADPTSFILWGKHAQEKAAHIDTKKHQIIASSHPSPMGGACFRGFFGSKPFSRTNTFLESHNRTPINWKIT